MPKPGRPTTTETDGLDRTPVDEIGDVPADEPETGPLRRCVVTRAVLPKDRMIRFVVGPDRLVVPDLAARLPGRGMWLSATWDVLHSGGAVGIGRGRDRKDRAAPEGSEQDKASGLESMGHDGPPGGRGQIASGKGLVRAFSRAARGAVTLPPDLPNLLRTGLTQRIMASLGLARRAGQAVAGFEKVREQVRAGQSALLLQAEDGSPSERARLVSAVGSARASGLTILAPLAGADLGRVFGRDYVVHVAIAPGKLADSLIIDAGRLEGLTERSNRTTEHANAPANEEAGTDEQI